MKSIALASAAVILLAAGAVVAAAKGPATDPVSGAALPVPDSQGSYLFWKRPEQWVGYRNIERIFPTRVIKRGTHVHALPKAKTELKIAYDFNGSPTTADSFTDKGDAAGVLVLHHGKIVLERYAHGYSPDQRWTSFSVGKSFSSTLLGAAVKNGQIKSLDDMVTDYLPGLKGSAYEGVSIRNVLNMTSGVKWNESYSDPNSDEARIKGEKSVNGSDPIVTYMARLPREAPPGTKWVYKTGETDLVGSIVRAATHKNMADLLSEEIWKPYGMEKDAVWMLDDAGHEFSGCCISATLRDVGRYGLFFMNGAKINGKPIVPDTWVHDATTSSKVAAKPDGSGYGYQWWVRKPPVYEASGIFGQMIHINPDLDLVIVTQSAWPTSGDRNDSQARAAFVKAVEDAVKAEG
jgi:CubicO group peptidase (beta-lactamase class C family)